MFCCESKAEPEEPVYDTNKIFFDEYGNIRYDQGRAAFNRETELRAILELDPGDDSIKGQTWYIIDAS
jgi:hypothetical protein